MNPTEPIGIDADGNVIERCPPELPEIAHWLRHIDRLDEIPGARLGFPRYNPLWDAAEALEHGTTASHPLRLEPGPVG